MWNITGRLLSKQTMIWPVRQSCCYQRQQQQQRWLTAMTTAEAVPQRPVQHLSDAAELRRACSVPVAPALHMTQLYSLQHCSLSAECFLHTAACAATTVHTHNNTTIYTCSAITVSAFYCSYTGKIVSKNDTNRHSRNHHIITTG